MKPSKSQPVYSTSKQPLSCRVSPLVKSLIALERKSLGSKVSEGEAVEALVLRASGDNPAALQLILKEAAKDPYSAALLNVVRATQKQ